MQSNAPMLPRAAKKVQSWSITGDDAGPYSHQVKINAENAFLGASSSAAQFAEKPQAISPASSLDERLYDARAASKLKIASVAMHLDQAWRKRFFAQIDNLLDVNEWEEGDVPITGPSFATLLRMLLLIKPKRRPGLGATSDGNIIGAWTVGKDRLTIECLPNDQVRWVVLHHLEGERETGAGQATLTRLQDVLAPYSPNRWFNDEGSEAPA